MRLVRCWLFDSLVQLSFREPTLCQYFLLSLFVSWELCLRYRNSIVEWLCIEDSLCVLSQSVANDAFLLVLYMLTHMCRMLDLWSSSVIRSVCLVEFVSFFRWSTVESCFICDEIGVCLHASVETWTRIPENGMLSSKLGPDSLRMVCGFAWKIFYIIEGGVVVCETSRARWHFTVAGNDIGPLWGWNGILGSVLHSMQAASTLETSLCVGCSCCAMQSLWLIL